MNENIINLKEDPNCFFMPLKYFTSRFIPHNYVVTLYKLNLCKNAEGALIKEHIKLWKGMEWQISMGDEEWKEYHQIHPEVERCPYRSCNVEGVSGLREAPSDIVDVISVDIREDSVSGY